MFTASSAHVVVVIAFQLCCVRGFFWSESFIACALDRMKAGSEEILDINIQYRPCTDEFDADVEQLITQIAGYNDRAVRAEAFTNNSLYLENKFAKCVMTIEERPRNPEIAGVVNAIREYLTLILIKMYLLQETEAAMYFCSETSDNLD